MSAADMEELNLLKKPVLPDVIGHHIAAIVGNPTNISLS
jgi:hypothetical protein